MCRTLGPTAMLSEKHAYSQVTKEELQSLLYTCEQQGHLVV